MKSIIIIVMVVFGIIQCFFWWLSIFMDNSERSFSPWAAISILVCASSLWILTRHKNAENTKKH